MTGEEIDAIRERARPFSVWACVGGKDDERHPHYRWVTGNRDFGPGYSSCADLAHVWLWCAGVRLPWVNTHLFAEGDMGKPGFDYQVNIDRLVAKPGELSRVVKSGDRFGAGDILISGNDSKMGSDFHAMVVLDHERERLLVAEYGQPGGHIKAKRVFEQVGGLWIEGRTNKRLQRWLPLDRVLMRADAEGKLADFSYPPGMHPADTIPSPPPEAA